MYGVGRKCDFSCQLSKDLCFKTEDFLKLNLSSHCCLTLTLKKIHSKRFLQYMTLRVLLTLINLLYLSKGMFNMKYIVRLVPSWADRIHSSNRPIESISDSYFLLSNVYMRCRRGWNSISLLRTICLIFFRARVSCLLAFEQLIRFSIVTRSYL